MMKRISLAVIVGAAIVFIYDFASWSLLSWHTPQSFTNNAEVAEVIQKNSKGHGMYIIPTHDDKGEANAKAIEEGPFVYAVVRPGKLSGKWGMGKPLALSFALNLFLALMIALVMKKRSHFNSRVMVGLLFGLFAGLSSALPMAIWMELPAMETIARVCDPLIAWLLAGIAMGAIIKSPRRKIFVS